MRKTYSTSIDHQSFTGRWQSRESKWLEERSADYWTIGQVAKAYGSTVAKLNLIMPECDCRCPQGSRTRIWKKERVIECLGDPKYADK